MKKLIGNLLFCAATTLSSGAASAATIDFNGLGIDTTNPVTVDGFVFNYIDHNGWAIGNPASPSLSFQVGNGTDMIGCRDTGDFSCSISMASADGSAFNLQSFDLADHSFGFGGFALNITYNLFGGGSLLQSVTTVADTVTTHLSSSPTASLSSVLFTWNGVSGNDGFVMDNIVVNEPSVSPVPLPAAGWLLFASLGGLAVIKRRRQKTTT